MELKLTGATSPAMVIVHFSQPWHLVSLILLRKEKRHYYLEVYVGYEETLLPIIECVALKHYLCLIK
jgi:hypothetical protein